ncbi:MAG: hypothetical protein AB7U73_21050, partial [Pirellulales bacterium]
MNTDKRFLGPLFVKRLALAMAIALATAISLATLAPAACADEPLRVLFLGDEGHHRPAAMAELARPALADSGIEIEYTADAAVLDNDKLDGFDCLLVFRDSGDVTAEQEG